ncbi:MAG: hypothetical protein KDD29_06040 [Flavobacteriales bacterium]|nr:hypothetical protein [Flavobacteriales bacterium]MCB9335706.1 hypothetical protein [Flavobacteriales bacterium]
MDLPIFINEKVNLESFIDYWCKLYSYPDENLYEESINKSAFINDDLHKLFAWKNGMKLSKLKTKSLEEKVISKLKIINHQKGLKQFDLEFFLNEFQNVSFVWKIFLLHIIRPNEYPIYDQHINRAYNYIHGKEYRNITNTISDKKKFEFYFNDFLPFVKSIGITDMRKIDKAFFAFGQFINTRNQVILIK